MPDLAKPRLPIASVLPALARLGFFTVLLLNQDSPEEEELRRQVVRLSLQRAASSRSAAASEFTATGDASSSFRTLRQAVAEVDRGPDVQPPTSLARSPRFGSLASLVTAGEVRMAPPALSRYDCSAACTARPGPRLDTHPTRDSDTPPRRRASCSLRPASRYGDAALRADVLPSSREQRHESAPAPVAGLRTRAGLSTSLHNTVCYTGEGRQCLEPASNNNQRYLG